MKASLEKALQHLLRPIVRLCVRYAVKVVDVESVLKTLFVQEAKAHLKSNSETESVSKISVMTGIQRPAVNEILNEMTNSLEPRSTNLLMKVIGAWQTKPGFTTSHGKPRVLQFEGKQSEFAKLVLSVSQALNPYTVLYELERAKLIEKGSRGLKLLSQSFISNLDTEQSLQFLSSDIADLTAAVDENLQQGTSPINHHLTTEYDNIPADKEKEIRHTLFQEGEKFHAKIRSILSLYDRDIISRKPNIKTSQSIRVALCSFARCEPIKSEVGEIQ